MLAREVLAASRLLCLPALEGATGGPALPECTRLVGRPGFRRHLCEDYGG
jgi:hypothetical protein